MQTSIYSILINRIFVLPYPLHSVLTFAEKICKLISSSCTTECQGMMLICHMLQCESYSAWQHLWNHSSVVFVSCNNACFFLYYHQVLFMKMFDKKCYDFTFLCILLNIILCSSSSAFSSCIEFYIIPGLWYHCYIVRHLHARILLFESIIPWNVDRVLSK